MTRPTPALSNVPSTGAIADPAARQVIDAIIAAVNRRFADADAADATRPAGRVAIKTGMSKHFTITGDQLRLFAHDDIYIDGDYDHTEPDYPLAPITLGTTATAAAPDVSAPTVVLIPDHYHTAGSFSGGY